MTPLTTLCSTAEGDEILLAALEEHIREALEREGLSPLHESQYRLHLDAVKEARAAIRSGAPKQ